MRATCLEVVPEDTSPWKPEIAPHAMVMNRNGIIGGAPGGWRFTRGRLDDRAQHEEPAVSRTSPVTSWWALR